MRAENNENQAPTSEEPVRIAPPEPETGPPADADETGFAAAVASITAAVEAVRWSAEQFRPAVTSEPEVQKLKLSAVAPLVAAAAGLRTVTKEKAKERGEDLLGGTANSKARRQFTRMCSPAGLLMPWYRPDQLVDALNSSTRAGGSIRIPAAAWQVKPDEPAINPENGEVRKYENLIGQSTIVGIHPSTPSSWLQGTPVLVTEGLLKAASALTGLLLDAGVTEQALALTDEEADSSPDTLVEKARARLRDLMAGVPQRERVLILVLVGVGNWHHNPEWNAIDLRNGRPFMVAFDGDIASNPNVYNQAVQLFDFAEHKGGDPSWLEIPDDGDAKRGIDDYLGTGGSFKHLLTLGHSDLPDAPETDAEDKNTDARMSEEKLVFEKKVSTTDEFGATNTAWVPEAEIIGRVARTVQRRPATDEEQATGVYDARAHDDAEGDVEIEVSYRGPDGNRVDSTVRGPARLLAEPPERWHRNDAAVVPVKVLEHPDWPPKENWLSAAKRHRTEDRTVSFEWAQMGWVPTKESTPVFIAGKDVLGARGNAATHATPGVTDHQVPASSRFGLKALTDENGRMDREAVAAAIRKVMSTIHGGALTSDGVVAIELAAALRPTVPVPANSVLFFSGARRSGKAIPKSTPVPTPTGLVCAGDIRIGDSVLAGDGSPTVVRGISEDHQARCMTVTLIDGRSLTTSANHLWRARTHEQASAGHAPVSDSVRAGLSTLDSGQSIMLEDLAAEMCLSVEVLETWVEAAGIPHEVGHDSYGREVVVHPVGEVLELASAMREATSADHPTPFTTVTTSTLAALLTGPGGVQVEDGLGGWVGVASVHMAGTEWVRCLTVEHYSGTFRAGADAVVTHNSWTAKQIMSFWQNRAGDFARNLPGSAADTGYFMENAVSHTPIWVADDLAPTIDKRKAEMAEAKIGDIIRAVFNRSSKGRMTTGGASREMLHPRALFMVTAENPQAASSEMDRVVHIVTGEEFFGDDEAKRACDRLAEETMHANHVTSACIQMIAESVSREGTWKDIVDDWAKNRSDEIDWATRQLGGAGNSARHAEICGDLLLGLEVLDRLCEHVELADEYAEVIQQLRKALVSYVRASFIAADATTPGASVVRALRSALASGAVHLGHPSSGQPPFSDEDDKDNEVRINQMLGWSYPSAEGQGERPGGRRVGVVVQREGKWYALLNPSAAFSEAQKAHPEIILHGSRPEPTWTSAWTEKLAGGPWSRKVNGGGTRRAVVRALRSEWVPFPLPVLLGTEGEEEDEQ
ncbi:hypothetical protein [Ornithinimicrobium murale]|uniref:hypothetical protein n=1 Tax=Ornithinimicrobium murale TaxID=1050153 RepID=UPI000E0E01CE|nr:hypothetical protein [Ornithinimicrobium murale]